MNAKLSLKELVDRMRQADKTSNVDLFNSLRFVIGRIISSDPQWRKDLYLDDMEYLEQRMF